MVPRGDTPQAIRRAIVAVTDPARLAELMAMALRARGFDVPGPHEQSYWAQLVIDVLREWNQLRVELPENDSVLVLDMPTARTKLLAIMVTPPDESSREACKKILRGDT